MLEDAQYLILVLHAILDGLEIVQYLIALVFQIVLEVVPHQIFVPLAMMDLVETHAQYLDAL